MEPSELEQLAKLPSKDILMSKILQSFNAPVVGLVGTLQGILRKFIFAVDAIAKKQQKNN